ncbi:MAG: valine--tRNA ligase [Gemmatimonadetes bacterium]|uniref:Valine--tRNA ligase n=1 Tax=Candidatus Kutchimonas denitrificans TaxID=3056748 RepID=A0AAE5CBQ1_9BACT|nr:valine--tRNA ligase [Gemmatimonadota bacterium]NIR76172.1 valine--tRNA ligase [Candidatus Kutchimonas denitrificans]NIS00612.1 valine--tRNA ligase [Gemmatimonadota bacterium]NIT66757.1 valine--tRNA ligase [Gemmatimonadota bacterium]NIV23356.1 valine--tRNA ligase [Gemmatimonadota bacterium]
MSRGKKPTELAPRFQPRAFEAGTYERWWKAGYFGADPRGDGAAYVIVMPPPNVTAELHMGHGLNNTVQDVLIRWRRMQGRNALWVPGTDHAGIATQNVVERRLAAEGQTRWDLGREAFVERVWDWVHETGGTILDQLKAIGSSADWDRTCFTLDPGPSRAVREVFVRLYEKGLVYRGEYIVNWCPRCATALANEEVEHEETEGALYYQRYPLAGEESRYIVVATTRPETMLGDTAVAVHPDDPRHKDMIGKSVILPLAEREIPIIADEFVDPEFGTGFVKVTPAHDPNDFEIGRRHDLELVDIFEPDATLSDAVPARFRGLDRFTAREAVVKELGEKDLLEKTEPHVHSVGHCYRCDTVVEPRVSEQWFVRMKPLAEPALAAYRDGTIRFTPEHWGGVYEHWLENVRDWCISRQLWWGHRIPVWYCRACDATLVRPEDPDACGECGADELEQDPDVLDTWFSSWLWPFSTLGWPEETPDLKAFYPGHTLVTAPEILFFWVARMIMAGYEFMGAEPFRHVYLTGTVRDHTGRRMSKSLGNGIDPLEVVELFGADALRFTLTNKMGIGADLLLNNEDLEESFHVGRNFGNKIWNAARLALPHLEGPVDPLPERGSLDLADRWILSRLNRTCREVTDDLERFRLHEAAAELYRFFWSELCDWYLELIKPRLYDESGGAGRDVARAVLREVLDRSLRLLHPIMPFITEELWLRLPNRDADSIMIAPWPAPEADWDDAEAEDQVGTLQDALTAVRNIRSEYNVAHGRAIDVMVRGADDALRRAFEAEGVAALKLAGIDGLSFDGELQGVEATAVLASGAEIHVPLEGLIDLERERDRLEKQASELRDLVIRSEKRLANKDFVDKAPDHVVDQAREKLSGLKEQLEKIEQKRAGLEAR